MKIISGHQPVYLPWLGLFHKLALCDEFVFMDTVQYLHNDWNNRNKLRIPDGWMWLSVPVDRKNSASEMLDDILIKDQDENHKAYWQTNHWKSIEVNYKKAPFFKQYEEELKEMYLGRKWVNLIDLCWEQFCMFSRMLGIEKKVIRMSEVSFEGKKDALVLDHCIKLNADAVVFGMHGKEYVQQGIFDQHNIKIYFQDYQHPVYQQRFKGFEAYMNVLDVLFNHGAASFDIIMENNVVKNDLINGDLWESDK